MQTEVRLPPHEPELAPTSAPPRRWPRRVVVALLVLIGAVLAFGGWFLANYDPICHEQCTGVSGVHGSGATDLGDFSSPKGEGFTAYRVDLVPGKQFSFWFTLSNDGPVPVTITHVGALPQPFDFYRVSRVQLQYFEGTAPPIVAFRPFRLSNNDFVNVLVTMQMRRCVQGEGAVSFGDIPVTFKLFGVTRHTTVYLPTTISLTAPKGTVCQG